MASGQVGGDLRQVHECVCRLVAVVGCEHHLPAVDSVSTGGKDFA